MKDINKIFCIGMNKTGTISLHEALSEMGFLSIHHAPSKYSNLKEHLESAKKIREEILVRKNLGQKLLEHIDNYEAYSDIGPIINNFEVLDIQYPKSKFIYTERDTDDWVRSRIKHISRNKYNIENGLYNSTFTQVDIDKWKNNKRRHLLRVKKYFKNRASDLLIIDICNGDGYEKLCPFLNKPILTKSFPKRNVINNSIS